MRPVALHDARDHVRTALAQALKAEFEAVYAALDVDSPKYEATPKEIGRRRLKNVCLSYLSTSKDAAAAQRALAAFRKANCMTDSLAALACLASLPGKEKEEALEAFYKKAGGDPLVLNKWFTIQALADLPDQVDRVVALTKHKVRAWVGVGGLLGGGRCSLRWVWGGWGFNVPTCSTNPQPQTQPTTTTIKITTTNHVGLLHQEPQPLPRAHRGLRQLQPRALPRGGREGVRAGGRHGAGGG